MSPAAGVSRLVLGVGNRHRGDDAAGLLVIDHLRGLAPTGVRLEVLEGAPLELAVRWESEDEVVLVDAARSDRPAGSLHVFDASAGAIPAEGFDISTHGVSVAQGIELARVLGKLPRRLVVLGVEGAGFEPGAPPTAAVAAAIPAAAERALAELGVARA